MNKENFYFYFFSGSFFLVSLVLSLFINYLFLKFSFTIAQRDPGPGEGQVRWSNFKPSIGGISFFIVFLVSISVVSALPREVGLVIDKKIIGLIGSCSLGFLLGLSDDAYNTNPLAKFIIQLSCACILIACDISIQVFDNSSLNFIISIIWVIGLMNSVNMLDNMDGITTSISAIIISGILVIIMNSNIPYKLNYSIILIGVIGSLIGFLRFNWNPSKIYMGDTGSQFLGIFLAAISMQFLWNFKEDGQYLVDINVKPFLLPTLFFIIPLIDTTTVTIRRLLKKRSPFVGGKDHITHHLVYYGLNERETAIVLIFITFTTISLGILLANNLIKWDISTTLICFLTSIIIFMFIQWIYNIGEKKKQQITSD